MGSLVYFCYSFWLLPPKSVGHIWPLYKYREDIHPFRKLYLTVSQAALHDAVASINILTDAVLILLPCLVFWKVQDQMRRYRVTALFATRAVYVNLDPARGSPS